MAQPSGLVHLTEAPKRNPLFSFLPTPFLYTLPTQFYLATIRVFLDHGEKGSCTWRARIPQAGRAALAGGGFLGWQG